MVALSNGGTASARSGPERFAGLFHGMATDLKASNGAWEAVCSRASKLSGQLNATAGALGHFVDALQTVSDGANNVNGISRDIGAALTRFCIRQRSVECALRSLGQVLQGQFTVDLERKCADWRLSISDAERRHHRTCKRLKGQQRQIVEAESRNSFVELLHAQRSQYTGFISALLPAINAQLALLDEANRVRQVRDGMEAALNESDAHSLVQALLEDIACCPESLMSASSSSNSSKAAHKKSGDRTAEEQRAWDQRVGIGLASSRAKSASQLRLCPSMSNGLDQQLNHQQSNGGAEDNYSQVIYGGGSLLENNHRNSMPPPCTSQQQNGGGGPQFWSPPTPSAASASGVSYSTNSSQHHQQHSPAHSSLASGGGSHCLLNGGGHAPQPQQQTPPHPPPQAMAAAARHHQRPPLPEAFVVTPQAAIGAAGGHGNATSTAAGNFSSSSSVHTSPTHHQMQQQQQHQLQRRQQHQMPMAPVDVAASSSTYSFATTPYTAVRPFFGQQQQQAMAGAIGTSMASSSCSVHTLGSSSADMYNNHNQHKTFDQQQQHALQQHLPPPPPPAHQNIHHFGQQQQQRPRSLDANTVAAAALDSVDGSATASSSSAALIAETLQQIDRLGLELDSYCNGLDNTADGHQQPQHSNNYNNGNVSTRALGNRRQSPPEPTPPYSFPAGNCSAIAPGAVRFRPDTLACRQPPPAPPPPPLPERRNSAISSATPTAPSIADIRSAGAVSSSSIAGRAQQHHQQYQQPVKHLPTPVALPVVPSTPASFHHGGHHQHCLQPVRVAPAPPATFNNRHHHPPTPMCPPSVSDFYANGQTRGKQ